MLTRSYIALTFVASLLFVSCSTTEVVQENKIKVGGLFSLTGGDAALDVPSRRGADLAVKKLNAAGGVLGRQLELITIDCKSDSASAALAAKNLAEQGVVAYVGLNNSDPAIGAGLVATAKKLPFITSGATYPKLPQLVGESIFLACFADNVQAAAAAEYAYDSLGKRKVAVLFNNSTTYTNALSTYFADRWYELAGPSGQVAGVGFAAGTTDFSAQIATIKAGNPDFIFASIMPEDLSPVIGALRSAGITMPIVGGDAYDAEVITNLPATQTDGVYFTTHALMSSSTSAGMGQFIESYRAEYGEAPPNSFAALGYDAISVLAEGMKLSNSTQYDTLMVGLGRIADFQALTGTLSYSIFNHIPSKSVAIIAMKNKAYTLAASLRPRSIPPP